MQIYPLERIAHADAVDALPTRREVCIGGIDRTESSWRVVARVVDLLVDERGAERAHAIARRGLPDAIVGES